MAQLKQEIVKLLKGAGVEASEDKLENPPQPDFGDVAFTCFDLSKKERRNPNLIAEDIAKNIKIPKGSLIERVEAKGGYVNFFFDWKKTSELMLKEILEKRNSYGSSKIMKGNSFMVEYAQPNTHKGFHIGHLRNICIGESLCHILEFVGNKPVRTSFQGDIGPHVAKCLWGFINLYKCKVPAGVDKGEWLGKVYAEASQKISADEKLEEQLKEVNNKLYSGDMEIKNVWEMTRKWSLDYFDKIYKELGTKFDKFYFESQVEKRAVEISKELLKKGIAQQSEGAIIIDLSKYGLGIFMLLTKEGNPLYNSKDLALAEQEFGDFNIDKCIHVVGSEQAFYFKQLFKVFELVGSSAANKSYHLVYELVTLKEGKMSSRLGTVVLYTQLRDILKEKINKEIEEREFSKAEKEKVTNAIALGALKYGMLHIGSDKTMVFDWEQALRLEGDTGPYLQYAHTRCASILEKAGKWKENFEPDQLAEQEKELIKQLAKFPETVEQAAKELKPHYICTYAFDLATLFSSFYQFCPVIKAEKNTKEFRLSLVQATKTVLANALNLLGIEALEKM